MRRAASGKKAVILVAEDNDDDFEMTSRALEKAGLQSAPRRCETGQELLDYIEDGGETPAVVLLDLNMPGVSGREALTALRRHEIWKKIPVVVFSTSDDPGDIDYCYRHGANSYIRKPLDINRLYDTMSLFKSYWFDCTVLPGESNK